MPGIDMSLMEQQEYYESLLKKYKNDKELLVSYKDICTFDISQLEKGPSEEFLNKQANKTIVKPENDIDPVMPIIDATMASQPPSTELTQSMETVNLKTNL